MSCKSNFSLSSGGYLVFLSGLTILFCADFAVGQSVRMQDLLKQAVVREKAVSSGEVSGVRTEFGASDLGPNAYALCLQEVDKMVDKLNALPPDAPVTTSILDLDSTVFFPVGRLRFDYRYDGDKYRVALDRTIGLDKPLFRWVDGVFKQVSPEFLAKIVSITDEAFDGTADLNVAKRQLTMSPAARSHEPWMPSNLDASLGLAYYLPMREGSLPAGVTEEVQEISPGRYQVTQRTNTSLTSVQVLSNTKTGLIEAATITNVTGEVGQTYRWCRPVEVEPGIWCPSVYIQGKPGFKESSIIITLFEKWRIRPVDNSEFKIPESAYDTVKNLIAWDGNIHKKGENRGTSTGTGTTQTGDNGPRFRPLAVAAIIGVPLLILLAAILLYRRRTN